MFHAGYCKSGEARTNPASRHDEVMRGGKGLGEMRCLGDVKQLPTRHSNS